MSIAFNEHTKQIFDALSLTTVLATLAAWLPPLAALASLLWTGLRMYESETVQKWLKCRRLKSQKLKKQNAKVDS